MIVALVPAKPLALAKTRLGTVLAPASRAGIAAAMFADVLAALGDARRVDAVLAVTGDPELLAHARRLGVRAVDEGEPRGLNGAVALGTQAALELGATTLVVVLSDVPLVRGEDLDDLCARIDGPGALLVPSKEGTGTNALVRTPPAIFGTRFGGRSLHRHVHAAELLQVPCEIVRNPRLAFDVDTPDDLRTLATTPGTTATHREAQRLGLVVERPVA